MAKKAGTSGQYQTLRAQAVAEFEKRFLTQLIESTYGNVSLAARAAGIERTYLHRLMRRHGIKRDAFVDMAATTP